MLKQACFQINWDSQNALVKEGQEGGGGQGRGQPVLQLGEDLCAPGSQVSTSITDQCVGQIVMVELKDSKVEQMAVTQLLLQCRE